MIKLKEIFCVLLRNLVVLLAIPGPGRRAELWGKGQVPPSPWGAAGLLPGPRENPRPGTLPLPTAWSMNVAFLFGLGQIFDEFLAVFRLTPSPFPLQPLPSAAPTAANRPPCAALTPPPARSRPQRQGQGQALPEGAVTHQGPWRCHPERRAAHPAPARAPLAVLPLPRIPARRSPRQQRRSSPAGSVFVGLYGARTALRRGTAPRGHTTRPAGAASAKQDGDRRGRYRDRSAPAAPQAGWGLCPCCPDGWRGGGEGRPRAREPLGGPGLFTPGGASRIGAAGAQGRAFPPAPLLCRACLWWLRGVCVGVQAQGLVRTWVPLT